MDQVPPASLNSWSTMPSGASPTRGAFTSNNASAFAHASVPFRGRLCRHLRAEPIRDPAIEAANSNVGVRRARRSSAPSPGSGGRHPIRFVGRRYRAAPSQSLQVVFDRCACHYGIPWGLHPGAAPASPGVQNGLILRGFLKATLRWRRGRDSHHSSAKGRVRPPGRHNQWFDASLYTLPATGSFNCSPDLRGRPVGGLFHIVSAIPCRLLAPFRTCCPRWRMSAVGAERKWRRPAVTSPFDPNVADIGRNEIPQRSSSLRAASSGNDLIGLTAHDVVAFAGRLLETPPIDFDQAPPI